jgi:hypothetical protein
MAIDRTLWDQRVYDHFAQGYPCPRCAKGHLRVGNAKIEFAEPEHSLREHDNDAWDPDWTDQAFTVLLTCDNASCGEIVAVSGRAWVESLDEWGDNGEPMGTHYATVLKPASMFPAPPLFPISKKLPEPVQRELKLAFQLYWADLSSSTSRLRTSLERVLDDKGIATVATSKQGKQIRLTLFDRIDLFEKREKDADSAESMNALRVVGNLGTHGDEVKPGDYFDLLDVYEDALLEIYEQKTAKLKAKKKALIGLK